MFSIYNMFFLLSSAEEFKAMTQHKLMLPGIIFSIGAIMLIICVLVQNISRKRKLQEAERIKRERIKRFSEESNMRYAPSQDSNDSLRQRRIYQEEVPSVNGSSNPMPQVAPPMPNAAPPVLPPAQRAAMPNTINPAVPTLQQAPGITPQGTPNAIQSNVPSAPQAVHIESAPQPSMGGQILPGMNAVGTVSEQNNNNTGTEDIAAMVRKRIQEIEDKKRAELSEEKNENDEKPQVIEKKEPEKKPKFEYKPEYKPGEEPKEEVKESKEEIKEEENKTEIKEEKVQEEIKENKQKENDEKEVVKEKSTNDSENNTEIKEEKVEKSENENEEKSEEQQEQKIEEIKKAPKVVLERSAEFIAQEEEEQKIADSQNATKELLEQVERVPLIPKVVSKKIEYNPGYLREVQSKINDSREYKDAINIKEEEKQKLKNELLEKRINLEKLKTKLQDVKEKQPQPDETIKLTKEEISKSLLDNVEKGITYEEGMKISLSGKPTEENKSEVKETIKEEIKTEMVTEEIKSEEVVVEENKTEEIQEQVQQVQQEEKTNDENLNEEIKKANEQVEEKIEEPKHQVINQIDQLFSQIDQEEKTYSSKDEKEFKENFERKIEERKNIDKEKEALKEIVRETKEKDLVNPQTINKVPNVSNSDIEKVKQNLAVLEEANQIKNNLTEEESNDLIRDRIRKKVEEEKKRKEEQLKKEREEKLLRQEQREQKNIRTKSILTDVDLDKELLSTKSIQTLSDTPLYKKIICVISPDSCGKTTVAVNMAYELANRGLKTCLIDTDNIKKDVYYYIHQEHIGCLSRLNEFTDMEDMYDIGIKVNDKLTVFTENKGLEYEINYSKLFGLINVAQEKNDCVIIDLKGTIGVEKTKDLLKLSTNILFVIDKKITTLNRIAERFSKTKGGFVNKDVTLVVNMDEGRGINKAAVKSLFKHLEYLENGVKKSYSIKIGEMFTVAYDTKSIIQGLISQLPAVTVKENKIMQDIRKIVSYYYPNN